MLHKVYRALEFILTPVKYLLLFLIFIYQHTLSYIIGGACRFEPTCSEYFKQALLKKGLIVGFYLGVRRLLRCHPFGGSGYDPVE